VGGDQKQAVDFKLNGSKNYLIDISFSFVPTALDIFVILLPTTKSSGLFSGVSTTLIFSELIHRISTYKVSRRDKRV
jgi:hypothetical protein